MLKFKHVFVKNCTSVRLLRKLLTVNSCKFHFSYSRQYISYKHFHSVGYSEVQRWWVVGIIMGERIGSVCVFGFRQCRMRKGEIRCFSDINRIKYVPITHTPLTTFNYFLQKR